MGSREREPAVHRHDADAARARLYPADLTVAQMEAYVATHPATKAEIYNPYTIVRRQGADLVARPYHQEFKPFVGPAAAALRRAAALSSDPAFARFLQLRADALLNDDYYASDIAWVDLQNPKFDVIFAPYETYLDDLLGVKTSYGAAVLIRNEAESRNLAKYQQWVPEIQDALPLAAEDRPSVRGHVTPMEVMDAPYRAGDLRHGYQAVADNLPNDPRIHQEKGTKKIFFKNFMDARVTEVILPLAARIMDPAQARQASAEGYLASTVLHEICHGLGPAFARRGGRQVDIREAIGGTFSGLEESKADVVGMFALKWLVDRDVLPKDRLEEYYASYVAGIFRTVRFGTGEAHGRAEMMEFNFLSEQGAIVQNGGRYRVVYANAGRHRAAGQRAARAGSDRRSRARRSVVRQVRSDAAGAEAGAGRRQRRADRRGPHLLVSRVGRVALRGAHSDHPSLQPSLVSPDAVAQVFGPHVATLLSLLRSPYRPDAALSSDSHGRSLTSFRYSDALFRMKGRVRSWLEEVSYGSALFA